MAVPLASHPNCTIQITWIDASGSHRNAFLSAPDLGLGERLGRPNDQIRPVEPPNATTVFEGPV